MPKKVKNLMIQIADLDNLRLAYKKTSLNKYATFGYLQFKEFDEVNLRLIQEELLDGSYQIGPYRTFTLYEPKERQISALGFKDRLVQHALCNIIEPVMDATLLPYTFACRRGMGTHACVGHVQSQLRQHTFSHFLKLDFKKYFKSIPCAVAIELYDRKIGCPATMALIINIIPPERTGIPIGSLTSQLTANLIGGVADRFVHFTLQQRHWARYMDDMVILGNAPAELKNVFLQIQEYVQARLKLDISRWHISPTNRGINFVGYRIWNTHKLIRKSSIKNAEKKIKMFVQFQEWEKLDRFLASWLGHIQWADCYNLAEHLYHKYPEIYPQLSRKYSGLSVQHA